MCSLSLSLSFIATTVVSTTKGKRRKGVDMGRSNVLFFLSIIWMASAHEESTLSSSCTAKLSEDEHQYSHHLNSSGAHLLLHHIRSPCSPLDSPPPTASDLLDRDNHRVAALLSRLNSGGLAESKDVKVPLSPGLEYNVGNYITRISLGTPAKSYVVIVDTGSSLSWVQCKPCKLSCYKQKDAIFNPNASSSYAKVACETPECKALPEATLNSGACTSDKVCIYRAGYGDSSFSVGYLSKDTLRLGKGATISGFVYGCGQENQGLFGQAAGLVGLARDHLSMLSQLAPKYGNAFSYCLPTASSSSSGYLSIGDYSTSGSSFTPMLTGSHDTSLYFVKLIAIYVAGKPISISAATFAKTPTIMDSGTVITRLPSATYTTLSRAVVAALKGYRRAPAYSILDTCFQGSYRKLKVPEVRLVFAGGAKMKLSAHNVFYDLDSNGITCLAFAPSSHRAIIGNRQQQTFKVVYDVARQKIGFGPGGCR